MKYIPRPFLTLALAAATLLACTPEFDPSYLEQKIDELDKRTAEIESTLKTLNSDIDVVARIVEAMSGNVTVTSVSESAGVWTISFSDGTSAIFSNGKDGQKGEDGLPGKTPAIGVSVVEGVYVWTVDGEIIKDAEGSPIPASGKNGEKGEDGQPGSTPTIGVKDVDGTSCWTVDGELLLDKDGQPIPAQGSGVSIFKSVTTDGSSISFTLTDGQVLEVPIRAAVSLSIEATKIHFKAGETRRVHIGASGISGMTITDKPEGWRASVDGNSVRVTAPASVASDMDEEGFVTILATSGDRTFINRFKVTMETPLFEMTAHPDGLVSISELDSDFNATGFWAGICEIEDFDPEAIIEPAKAYTPTGAEGFYTTFEGDSYGMNIKDFITSPIPGRRYVAWCFPGAYSRWIGVSPDPYNVYVKYFTYTPDRLVISSASYDKATLNLSFSGAAKFYGGITRIFPDTDLTELATNFLSDAAAPLEGVGDGMYGVLMDSYSGGLDIFAALDDGSGSKNTRSVVPGATYALGLIPMDSGRDYAEYTADDVIIRTIQLSKPSLTSLNLVTGEELAGTTTSAAAQFSITSSVSKFYYTIATVEEIEASGLNDYEYALRYGIAWDRSILKAVGAVSGIDCSRTGIKPGTACRAIGVGFTSGGSYNIVTVSTSSREVLLSAGSLSFGKKILTSINANSTKVGFPVIVSSDIVAVRYVANLTVSEFGSYYNGSEDEIYELLTAGSRWSYEQISPSTEDTIEMYIYPEDTDYVLFAVGVDDKGMFTELQKVEFKPID